MANTAGIPEKLTNFNLYNYDGSLEKQVGITGEVSLPTLEALTETISGAGILGEYDSVTPGHFGPTEIEIPYRLVGQQSLALAKNKVTTLIMRGAMQNTDISSSEIKQEQLKVMLKGTSKGITLGKAGIAKQMETTGKLEILYIKMEVAGFTILELDKQNFVFIVNGEDQLAEIKNMM